MSVRTCFCVDSHTAGDMYGCCNALTLVRWRVGTYGCMCMCRSVYPGIHPSARPHAHIMLCACVGTGVRTCVQWYDSAKKHTFPHTCTVSAGSGSLWKHVVARGSLKGLPHSRLYPYLCTQAAGRRPQTSHAAGWRFIPNPSRTDSCVLKDTARCPLSYSKGFR